MDYDKREFFKNLSPSALIEVVQKNVGKVIPIDAMQSLENVLGGTDQIADTVAEASKITRNQFINITAFGSLAAIVWAYLGCSTAPRAVTPEDIANYRAIRPPSNIVHYPRLPGKKIQSPEHYGLEGCMIGYNFDTVYSGSWIKKVERKIGRKPSLFFISKQNSRIPHRAIYYRDPTTDKYTDRVWDHLVGAAKLGVIPALTYDARYLASDNLQAKLGNVRDQVIEGTHDIAIKEAAKILKQFGDEYGGFFIRTMREMNLGHVWPWAGNEAKFKKAWIHIWDIFDGEGVNEYATWVWNPYVGNDKRRALAPYYYPGDEYVDWIAFNGYNWDGQGIGEGKKSFSNLFSAAYEDFIGRKKPMMVAETGMDNLGYRPSWMLDVFETAKKDMPGLKALTFHSVLWSDSGIREFDSRIIQSRNNKILDSNTLEAVRIGVADDYFLSTIPYTTLK